MAKREFKTESKRILDLMINSVYTHKDIFLRELISNASDAIDKLYFRSLTDSTVTLTREDYRILLSIDKEARTLTISDNGCGMTESDLVENLGVIAHSGTLEFRDSQREAQTEDNEVETIGQFGVGFYASFMVAQKVQVLSLAYGESQGYLWESTGVDGYTLQPADKAENGTTITLFLKDNTEEEKFDEFIEVYRLKSLIKKHSDYIRYPIMMDIESVVPKADVTEESEEPQTETVVERQTLNSMIPIWRKNKADLTEEEYSTFYKDKFGDYQAPQQVIHYKTEGVVTYNALLYIPSDAPYNYYSKDFQRGLQLYANGVLIMDKCADLLPDHFSFVRGLIDSQDLSLNISREMLQHDRQLKAMAKSVEKKIRSELEKLLKDDREKYETFYKQFGRQLKYGLYQGFGMTNKELQELTLFHSMKEDKLVTLSEYVGNMDSEQKYFYYVCAETPAKAALLPQTERVLAKGWDILCLTDDVDEFIFKMLSKYGEKEFRSVSSDEVELSETEQETQKTRTEENKDLLAFMKDALGGKVSNVIVSARLGKHPVCLSSEGELSIEMEKVLSAMPTDTEAKANRVLEINPDHPVFSALQSLLANDKDKLTKYASLLYTQALLIEGLPVDDPVAFSNDICSLMA